MKSYTDLEQSKKLAEILPPESADMRFCFSHTLSGRIIGHYPMIGREPSMGTIPCWSLAALINVIKPYNKNTYTIKGTLDGGALISFDEVTNVMYQEKEIVDAVYEMILWLNEKRMI